METNEILFADAEDVRIAVSDALGKIGKTFEELAEEAPAASLASALV